MFEIGDCETQKPVEYSDNISGKSPLRRGSKTREGGRDSFPSAFCGSGLAGTLGAVGFERTYWQNILVNLCFAIARTLLSTERSVL